MTGEKSETEFYSGTGSAIFFYQNRGLFFPEEPDEL